MRTSKTPPHAVAGFTLVELMTTIAVLSILAAIAVPSFRPVIENWRTRNAAAELQSTLYFARSEAVKRGGMVWVESNSQGTDWATGWTVKATEGGKDVVLQQSTVPPRTTVSQESPGSHEIFFDRWGMASSMPGGAAGAGTELEFMIKPASESDTSDAAIRVCASPAGGVTQKRQGGSCPT